MLGFFFFYFVDFKRGFAYYVQTSHRSRRETMRDVVHDFDVSKDTRFTRGPGVGGSGAE